MQNIRRGLLAAFLCTAFSTLAESADPTAEFRRLPPAAETILAKPDRLELLSLDPAESDEKPANAFHDWKVLGSTVVNDAKVKVDLIAALKKSISENDGAVAGCFNPRHGLRATLGGKTVDVVICFECFSMVVYSDGNEQGVWITGSPQPTFDKVLRDAKVPLPKKPE